MSACLANNFASEHVPNFKSDQQVKIFSKKESEKAMEILTPDNAICGAGVDVALAGAVHWGELCTDERSLDEMARIGHERGILVNSALARVHTAEVFIAIVSTPNVGWLSIWGRHLSQIPELDGLIFAVGNEVPSVSLRHQPTLHERDHLMCMINGRGETCL